MMGDIVSSDLADGEEIAAAQMNQLRDDLLKNHDHSSGKGATVDHADLVDGAMPQTYLDHTTINQHVQGSGTSSAPDNPGGSQGVHGLGSYLAGSLGHQYTWQFGSAVTDETAAIRDGWVEQIKEVTFTTSFTVVPQIVLVCPIGGPESANVAVSRVSETSFKAHIAYTVDDSNGKVAVPTTFHWAALGRKS